jgi:methionyl-tRNA formyltransferase
MRIVFFGTPAFALPSFTALLDSGKDVLAVVSQPDKKQGRGHKHVPPPVKEYAVGKGIEVLQPLTTTDGTFVHKLSLLKPDIIVVVAYGKMLRAPILTLPPYGCVNVHASLLPKYRGAAPIQWALIKGEVKTGITTMMMDEGLDTGDILLQEVADIDADDTAQSLGKRLAELSAPVLLKTLEGLENGTLAPSPQTGTPSFAPPFKKEDGAIDWAKTAPVLHDFIRGMYPWPCAYCYLNKERIKITKAKALEGSGLPRRIEHAGNELVVGTGKGLLAILELQPEGKKIMSVKAFLQGRKLGEGTFFDEPEIDERRHT